MANYYASNLADPNNTPPSVITDIILDNDVDYTIAQLILNTSLETFIAIDTVVTGDVGIINLSNIEVLNFGDQSGNALNGDVGSLLLNNTTLTTLNITGGNTTYTAQTYSTIASGLSIVLVGTGWSNAEIDQLFNDLSSFDVTIEIDYNYISIPSPPVFTDTVTINESVGSSIESGELNGKKEVLVDTLFQGRFRPNGVIGTELAPYRVKSLSESARSIIGGDNVGAGQQVIASLNNSNFWEFYHITIEGNTDSGVSGISGISWGATTTGASIKGQDIIIKNIEFANLLLNTGTDGSSYSLIDFRFIYGKGYDVEGEGAYIGNTSKTANISNVDKVVFHHHAMMDKGRDGLQITHCDDIDVQNCTYHNVGVADTGDQNNLVQIHNSHGTIKNCIFDGAPEMMNNFCQGVTFENCIFIWNEDLPAYIGDLESSFGASYVKDNHQPNRYINCEFRPTVLQTLPIFNINEKNCDFEFTNCKITSNVANGMYTDNRGGSAYTITETGTVVVADRPSITYTSLDVDDVEDFLTVSDNYYQQLGVGHRSV